MPPNPRPEMRLLQRRAEVAKRYLSGEQQWDIARALNVDQSQISRDLKAINALWLDSLCEAHDGKRALELAKIDANEIRYLEGWERSHREETHAGDPRFLDGVMKCIERRCALLGLDAVKKFSVNWDKLNEQQLERLASGEAFQQVMADA